MSFSFENLSKIVVFLVNRYFNRMLRPYKIAANNTVVIQIHEVQCHAV
jgi:hypothetical protein